MSDLFACQASCSLPVHFYMFFGNRPFPVHGVRGSVSVLDTVRKQGPCSGSLGEPVFSQLQFAPAVGIVRTVGHTGPRVYYPIVKGLTR